MTQDKKVLLCEIISNECIADGIFKLAVRSAELAAAHPGQFAMLKCGGATFLRRPLSLCTTCMKTGTAVFIYRLAGAGTLELSMKKAGEKLDVIGPLGNGFEITLGRAAVVGGGIGVIPLLLLVKRLREYGCETDVFAGFQNAGSVILENEFRQCSDNLFITSDDGSAGEKGFVTDLFSAAAKSRPRYDTVYACGPAPMLRKLHTICAESGVNSQFSLEERMGCGIGACLVCACAVKTGRITDVADGAETFSYARVCRDGPVFSLADLIYD